MSVAPILESRHLRWHTQVRVITLLAVPALSGVFVSLLGLFGLDTVEGRSFGHPLAVAAGAALWAYPLATAAPHLLASLTRRTQSMSTFVLASAASGGIAALLLTVVMFAPFVALADLIEMPTILIWVVACSAAFGGGARVSGRASARDLAEPTDVDGLIVRGLAYILFVCVGWIVMIGAAI